jgi:calpain-15
VKLRNPWGKEQYRGEWSDKDDRWTPELKQSMGYQTGDDGFFYMPFSGFKKAFSRFVITMYDKAWNTQVK